MPSARKWFEDFTEDEFSRSGPVWVEFWGARIQVRFDKQISEQDASVINGGPSDRQFQILDAIIQYRDDFVATLEHALFEYYMEHAYDVATIINNFGDDVTDRHAPELHSAAEVWKLIRDPYLSIPYLDDDSQNVEFIFMMKCTWDSEHGVCAVVRDWKIAADEVGQIGDFYDVFTK